MVSYLQIENLTKSIGDRMLFSDVTFGVYEGDKIGLIARNGAGKTTFLNVLASQEDADYGSIIFRNGLKVGYLPQQPLFNPEDTVLQYATPPDDHHDDHAWDAGERAKRLLTQFGISDLRMQMKFLSGGQRKRAALAKVLLTEPDFLMLDEPTNHLDIDMIEWLENYLTRQRITLLMVTHDRYFLDRVCNKIIEIDREQIYTYEGNYDYFLTKRRERLDNLSSELAKVKNLLRTETEWMRRQPQARGSKAKYRIDNFHRLEQKSHINLEEKKVSLGVKSSYIGNKIFIAHDISKAFGDNVIINDWNYTFTRYEKVGIVGDNGVGKSTFLKLLIGQLSPDKGHFEIGETVRWGYYSQDGMTGVDDKMKVIDAVREIAEIVRIDDKTTLTASQFLSHFLFTPETQQKYIYKLSGGERRRLYLATVLMRSPNFIILDEPTNDLDIVTLTVLEDYLVKFKGCVIIVSHDRFFLDSIVDHLFVFTGEGTIRDFPGDYSTYRHCLRQEEKERLALEKTQVNTLSHSSSENNSNGKLRSPKPVKLSFKERKEMEQLEQLLPRLTEEKTLLEQNMSSGEMTVEEITAAGLRMQQLIDQIDTAELRLLELMEKE